MPQQEARFKTYSADTGCKADSPVGHSELNAVAAQFDGSYCTPGSQACQLCSVVGGAPGIELPPHNDPMAAHTLSTCPNTTCLPSRWGVGTVVIKNWLPAESNLGCCLHEDQHERPLGAKGEALALQLLQQDHDPSCRFSNNGGSGLEPG